MVWNPKATYLRVCVTVNLPDGKTHSDYNLETLRTRLNPSFLLMGREEQGRKHFQGYMEFPKRKIGSAINSAFRTTFPLPISVHFEPSMGTAQQNVDYCTKEDPEPFTFGDAKQNGQGSRTDLAAMVEQVKSGASDQDLLESNPGAFLVHHKAFQVVRSILAPKRQWPSKLVFIWGETGFGKTRESMKLQPQKLGYRDPFMIGYNGQKENVLFDDFKWSKMDPKYWLELCDRYEMTVENKGTTVNWAPKIIIFTSNDDPMDWWPEAPPETKAAIHRRIGEFGEVIHLGNKLTEGQSLLTKYLAKPAAVVVTSQHKEGAGGAGADTSSTVDLTQDSDSDDDHSVTSNVGRAAKRLRREPEYHPDCRRGHMCNGGACYCF